MNQDQEQHGRRYALYLGKEHECSYLPNREARSLFFDPNVEIDPVLEQRLIDVGFRRSGIYMYRPYCEGCRACIPVRIPVEEFRPDRSQRRCQQRNRDLEVRTLPARFRQEQFDLYSRYAGSRHGDGPMANLSPERYMDFLTSDWSNTRFFEFRQEERLVAVAVTDLLPQGLSAMYTYFDPALTARSLGVFAVLWQIEYAREQGLPHVYLGYRIHDCRKMNYKDRFRPMEAWDGNHWRRYPKGREVMAEIPGTR